MALREGQKAKALFDYEARAPDELSFKRRDIITVLDKDEEDEGWYRGEINGKTGLFPNNYVQLIEKPAGEAPAAAAPKPASAVASGAGGSGLEVPKSVRVTSFTAEYTVAEMLGRGRFSQVRRCVQQRSGKSVAVKMMDLTDPELGTNLQEAEREVVAEVRILAELDHLGVVKLLETIKWEDKYYLVTEGLSGGDLFDRIERHGPYSEDDAAPLLLQVANAVSFLHERQVGALDGCPAGCACPCHLPPV
jgi:hypothetical protein